jgi:hypothetical protein
MSFLAKLPSILIICTLLEFHVIEGLENLLAPPSNNQLFFGVGRRTKGCGIYQCHVVGFINAMLFCCVCSAICLMAVGATVQDMLCKI